MDNNEPEKLPLSAYDQLRSKSKKGVVAAIFILVGFVLFHICGWFFPSFQYHGAAFLNYGIILGMWYVADKWILTKVDFQETVKDNAIAVALTFIGHCMLICVSYFLAVLPFFTLR